MDFVLRCLPCLLVPFVLTLGCHRPEADVSPEDLCGTWVVSEEGLRIMQDMGYRIYTNRFDHMLRLNKGYTCVFRGFTEYRTMEYWRRTGDTEETLFNYFPLEVVTPRYWKFTPEESYSAMEGEKLSGPFWTTNDLGNGSSRSIAFNKWPRWRILEHSGQYQYNTDVKSAVKILDREMGRWPYGLECLCHVVLLNRYSPSFENTMAFHVARDKEHGLHLWLPAYETIDWVGRKIIFTRVIESEGMEKEP